MFELAAVPLSDGMIAARQIVELYFDEGEPERVSGTIEQRRAISNPNVYVQAEKEVLPVERVYVSASRQVRDRKLVTSIRRIYKDKCSVCGKALPLVPKGSTFAEVGHVRPVGLPFRGPDHISNVLPFCPNHHRQFDRGVVYFEVDGKKAKVVDRSYALGPSGRVFTPATGHPLDMSYLTWHADYFLQR